MKLYLSLLIALYTVTILAQNAAFPLESVKIEGSAIIQSVILNIAGLHLKTPIDEAGMQQACQKLQESGLFSSINYRYAPGPEKGYALTLSLADVPVVAASIDVPGADENEAWTWLSMKFGRFNHQAPETEPGQRLLAAELERHLATSLHGQHMTVRLETDLQTHKSLLSFQPEILPRVVSVAFTGNQAVSSNELATAVNAVVTNEEFTQRKFAAAVDLNLRRVYEQHGFYRVQFTSGGDVTEAGVAAKVTIVEGPQYQLGKVELTGDNLPIDAMLSAASLPNGKIADWKQIQQGIWEMERVVKRTGYLEAMATPDRSYDDASHVLSLRIRFNKGPLYRFGEVHFTGLSPDLEARAQHAWKPKPGDPYDVSYVNEFFKDFSHGADVRNYRKFSAKVQKGAGDHVQDITVVFEAK